MDTIPGSDAGTGIEIGTSAPQAGRSVIMFEPPPQVKGNLPISSVEPCLHCHRPRHADGLCQMHYRRKRRHGDPLVIGHPGGRGPLRREDDGLGITYFGQHRRVEAVRGKPRLCEDCGLKDPDTRYDWAFNNTGSRSNPDDYLRLCGPCHRKLDAELLPRGQAHWKARASEAVVREIRELYAKGGHTYRSLGQRFGLGHVTVKDIVDRKTWAHVKLPPCFPGEDQPTGFGSVPVAWPL